MRSFQALKIDNLRADSQRLAASMCAVQGFIAGVSSLVVTVSLCAASDAAEVDVYLLAGQYNMQGNAKLGDLPEAWPTSTPNCLFWNGEKFEPLEPGTTRTSTRPDEFGPELGFARTLSAQSPERPFYLVEFNRSGQPPHHGWDGNRWVGGKPAPSRQNFYPGEDANDPDIGKHYRDMLATAKAAFKALQDEGHSPKQRAIVWMQGEQVSKHEVSASEYAASIARLRGRSKTTWRLPPHRSCWAKCCPTNRP